MARNNRQLKILELIKKYSIDRQDDLVRHLQQEGYHVTQATVSRDINELGLVKMQGADKKYRYVHTDKDETASDKMYTLFKETVISITSSLNIIVIKTLSGSANAAAALLDKLEIEEILGTIAGDDTLMVIVSDPVYVPEIVVKLNSLKVK